MSAARPEDVSAFAARCFIDAAGQKLPYRILLPEPIAPGMSYPLVVVLHGAGERGTDNLLPLGNGVAAMLTRSRGGFPCVAVVPQCPPGLRWVEVDWSAAHHPLPSIPSLPLHAVLALVDALADPQGSLTPAAGLVDPARLYLMGLSMGGYGVWDAVSRQPQRFAAAVPICGGAAEDQAASLCAAGLPIWAFHGARDPVVPVERSRRIVSALRGCRSPVRYTEYPEVGHDAWTWALQEPELLPWLFSQENSLVTHIRHGTASVGRPY